MKPQGQQTLRIIMASDHLPKDKESVYWLNLQDIPPALKGSGIAIALRTKLKLFYRPEALLKDRKGAEEGISLQVRPDGRTMLVNTTPYIYAIGSLLDANGKKVAVDNDTAQKLLMFMPGDEVQVKGNVVKVDSERLRRAADLDHQPEKWRHRRQRRSRRRKQRPGQVKNNPFRSCGVRRNHDEKALMAVALFSALPVLAADYSEKTQYLGVVNGQVVGNSVVKVTRTPADPVLYRTESNGPLPETLVIRNAESRPASGNMAYITVKRTLGDGRDARLTLKTTLMVDGQRTTLTVGQRGEDVIITVPAATRQVELRSDAPAELEVPANYRGNVQVPVEVEGVSVS